MPNGKLEPLKSFAPRKYAPIGVGIAWFAALEGAGFVIQSSGHPIDLIYWRAASVVIAATASIVSRSHVLKLGVRLVAVRLIHSFGLTSKASYLRMRSAVEQTFEDDIKTKT
jgi:hypothetical protein